jgi:DNA polymerase-1
VPPAKPRLFLIDGSSQMYRAYHAIRGLTGPDGKSTNAVYGFATMLRKLIADQKPEYIAASFDLAGPTFRDDIVSDYKAHREPMPSDLAEQVPLVREACEALGVPVLTYERYEADDVIGTLAMQATAAGFDVAIVTGDKDFFQLVSDSIRVFNPRDEGTWFDAAGVVEKFGVRPDQVVDVLALMGDSVDNIKGVPGIGEKGARDLISTYGTLDKLLESAAEVQQKRYREGLLATADDARTSRELARIRVDVPVVFDPAALRFSGPAAARCYALFSRLGFRTARRGVRTHRGDLLPPLSRREKPGGCRCAGKGAGRCETHRHRRRRPGRLVGQRRCHRLVIRVGARVGVVRAARAFRPERHAESARTRGVRARRSSAPQSVD